jgi:hypothetical protein
MHRRRLHVVSGSMAAGLVLLIASCSDAPTGAIPSERTDDFVAEGMVYNQIWAPATTGLRLVATSERQTIVSRRAGSVQIEGREIGFRIADSATARMKRFAGTSPLSQAMAAPGSVAKLVLKARKIANHRVEGKNVAVAAVPDGDRASGRPPRAIILLQDDRIAAITEYTWGRRGRAWRAVHSRTTFLDEHGRLGIVFEQDASKLAYRSGTDVGVLDQLRGGVGLLLPALGRLVQPDALYAATEEEGVCITEGLAAAAAAAAVIGAGYYVQAAQAALAIATAALTTAMAGCMIGVVTCPALDAAILAEAAAAANLRAAQATLVGASLAAGAADYALSECWRKWRERQDKPDETVANPSGGSESGCGDDGEEWCQWTLSWPDGRLTVRRDYCWCEGKDREYEM